jgi:outer membrane protein OmpA-like peptidoglycan-associated protein
MVKQHIPRDANRIALMTELTYRHLYGQIFCKVPGDVSAVMEVSVLDGKGAVVATVRPDSAGRFYLSNLHPDQNYSFRFKNDFPDCKINIMDNNGFVLYVVEKGKKGKYIFDKLAYETVHTAINDAHFLGDSVVTPYHRNSNGEIVIPSVSIAETVLQPKATKGADSALNPQQQPKSENIQPVNNKGKIIVNTVPDNISTEELLKANRLKDTIQSPDIADKKTADTVTYKGKMVVKDVPDGVSTKEFLDKNKSEEVVKTPQNTEENKVAPVKPGKGKMLVSDLLDSLSTTAVSQGKLKTAPVGSDILKKYRLAGVTLTDLANQVAKFYDGTVICVLNDSAYCVDITKVNAKGEFLLFDFLSFKMTLPDSGKHIVSQTVFLNERMELVEVVNKRIINGLYAYVLNSKEALENRVYTVIKPNKANAVLFTTIFFEKGNVQIAGDRVAELDKVAAYLVARPLAIVYLAGYPDGRSPGSRSKKFCDDRLKSTIEYLVSKGVKSTRIKQRGNGNTQPLAREGSDPAEDSEKYRRRLEIYIKNR